MSIKGLHALLEEMEGAQGGSPARSFGARIRQELEGVALTDTELETVEAGAEDDSVADEIEEALAEVPTPPPSGEEGAPNA